MADDKLWDYQITDEDHEKIKYLNGDIVDLVKYLDEEDIKESEDTPSEDQEKKESGEGEEGEEGKGTGPGGKGPSAPAPTTPPSGGGGEIDDAGVPEEMSGAHSTKTSRVRGIESKFAGQHRFVDPTYWVRRGTSNPSWANILLSKKWQEFQGVKNALKKKWDRLMKEEITDFERGNLIGDDIDMDDYVAGRDKYFNKTTQPDKEEVELNIILALDASGSTGSSRQYSMSGLTFAVKRAFEELGVRHSLMVYDHQISLVDIDKKGLSNNANCLMADYCGSGGNDEAMVLDIAKEIARKNDNYKNVVIIISDGGVANIKEDLDRWKLSAKNDMNVYCLGYEDDFDEMQAGNIFGKEFAIGSANKGAFAENIIRVLEKELRDALIKEAQ